MKKLLSLLLAMLLCLGALIACDNGEESSNSSSEEPPLSNDSLVIENTTSTYVRYYYHETRRETVSEATPSVVLIEDYKDYTDFLERVGAKYTSIEEEYLENYYLFKIKRTYVDNDMGYRNFKIEGGKASIIFDFATYYDARSCRNGEPYYSSITLYSNAETETTATITETYDFVLVPKSDVDIEISQDTEVVVYHLQHHIRGE